MDEKARFNAAAAAVDRLRAQLLERVPLMPEHWDQIEIEWLLADLGERNTTYRRDLDQRWKAFNYLVRHHQM